MLLTLLFSLVTALPQSLGGEWGEIWSIRGSSTIEELGYAVSSVSDLDADLNSEVIVGSIRGDVNGSLNGTASVFSGVSGTQIFFFEGELSGGAFGRAVGSADVNADGFDDILVGAPFESPLGAREGAAYVFSGKDSTLLIKIDGVEPDEAFGTQIGRVGDVNLDGHEDFFVQSSKADTFGVDLGSAHVYSGKTLTLLYEVGGPWSGTGFDGTGIGDINNDGYPDLVMSDTYQGGTVATYSGLNGSFLYRIPWIILGDDLGFSVANVGDANFDGIDDFIAGAPEVFAVPPNLGHAYVFSGVDGSMLFEFSGDTRFDQFGWDVAGPGDVDGDGFPDFLIGSPFYTKDIADQGGAFIYSGFDGRLLAEFYGDSSFRSCFGWSVTGMGDLNDNGLPDIAIGAKCDSTFAANAGAAFVYTMNSYLQADFLEISSVAGGTVTFTLDFPDSEAGSCYQLLASTDRPGRTGPNNLIPLDYSKVFRQMQYNPPSNFSTTTGTLDASGNSSITMTLLPNEAAGGIGRTCRFAAITYDSTGTPNLSSTGLRFKVLP